jgi:membrane-bound acyltransferase YfiQ involved in biofilm formation
MFRNGIYLFVFLTGYYIFSQEKIIDILAKFNLPLLAAGIILGIINVWYFYGQNYTDNYIFQHPVTNIYSWIMMMAILGCSQKYFNITNKFLDFIKSRSFFWYLSHYPIMVLIAYILVSVLKLPMIYIYILLLLLAFGVTVIFCEIIRLIPVLRYLLFGINNLALKGEVCCSNKVMHSRFNTLLTALKGGVLNPSARIKKQHE